MTEQMTTEITDDMRTKITDKIPDNWYKIGNLMISEWRMMSIPPLYTIKKINDDSLKIPEIADSKIICNYLVDSGFDEKDDLRYFEQDYYRIKAEHEEVYGYRKIGNLYVSKHRNDSDPPKYDVSKITNDDIELTNTPNGICKYLLDSGFDGDKLYEFADEYRRLKDARNEFWLYEKLAEQYADALKTGEQMDISYEKKRICGRIIMRNGDLDAINIILQQSHRVLKRNFDTNLIYEAPYATKSIVIYDMIAAAMNENHWTIDFTKLGKICIDVENLELLRHLFETARISLRKIYEARKIAEKRISYRDFPLDLLYYAAYDAKRNDNIVAYLAKQI